MPIERKAAASPRTQQKVLSIVLGTTGLLLSVVLALALPTPTHWQQYILRGLIAVSIAAFVPIIPGTAKLAAKLQGRGGKIAVVGTSAVALFLAVLLLDPPYLNADGRPAKDGKTGAATPLISNAGDCSPVTVGVFYSGSTSVDCGSKSTGKAAPVSSPQQK